MENNEENCISLNMFYVNSLLEHAKAKQGIHLNELKNIQLTILNEIQELKLKRWGSD